MATGTIYNTTRGPLVIDDDGHVLGAGERLDDVELDGRKVDGRRVKSHIDAGRLIVIDEPEPEQADERPRAQRRGAPSTEEA